MKMFTRLRYLLEEGFEVSSISGYDDDSGNGNARVMFLERRHNGARHVRSEIFDVDATEMEHCSNLFLAHLARRDG